MPGAKERALLADLVVHAGRVVSADRLVEDLWGDDPPGNPANTLQGRVSALRRALGVGRVGAGGDPPARLSCWRSSPEGVDAGRFEGLVAEATALARRSARGRPGCWRQGLGLWRGAALAEFADRPWAQAEAARLEELRLAAVEALVELRLAAGGHAGLVGELEGLVAAHPTRERLRGQLMVALYRSGRQADALGVYQADPGGAGRGAGDRPVAGAAAAPPGDPGPGPGPGAGGRGHAASPATTCPSG